jgi:uncharacterized protein YegL
MNHNLTEIVVILDKSGSMDSVRDSTISNFNEFIQSQKNQPGEANFTLVLFSSNALQETVMHSVPITRARRLNRTTYRPDGMTALFDAVVSTIKMVSERIEALPEDDKPSKVIVCVITDGQENDSRTYGRKDVSDWTTKMATENSWQFMYIGANQDSFQEARSLGIRNAINYNNTSAGVHQMTRGMSNVVSSYRATGSVDMSIYDNKIEEENT